jgi:hypothetical protein
VFDVIRGDQQGLGDTATSARVRRYEVAEATPTTSSRQFQFELYKRRTTVLLPRDLFLDLVLDLDALALYKFVAPNQRTDLMLACRSVQPHFPPPPPLSSPLPFCHCNSKTPHFAEKIIINPLFCGNMLFRCHSCLLRRSETFSSSYII